MAVVDTLPGVRKFEVDMSHHRVKLRYDASRADIQSVKSGVAREKLLELIKHPGKTFFRLNKYGMHFPYFGSHPQEYDFFTPALVQGEPMSDREKSLNSYMNGLRWGVDD